MYDSDIDFLVNLGLLSIFFIFIVVIVLAWICQYVANSFFKNNHIIALNKNIKSRKMVESFLEEMVEVVDGIENIIGNLLVSMFRKMKKNKILYNGSQMLKINIMRIIVNLGNG